MARFVSVKSKQGTFVQLCSGSRQEILVRKSANVKEENLWHFKVGKEPKKKSNLTSLCPTTHAFIAD